MTISKKKKNDSPLARKIAPRVVKPVEVKPSKLVVPPNPSLRLYRRIAGGFIAAVLVLLLLIVALSTTKAIIKVTPLPRTVETSFLVDVLKSGTAEGKILGMVVEQTFEQSKSFPVVNGEKKEALDKSGGLVKIINNSSRNQSLVATTRLLSSGGVLFRIDKGVTVPAGGSVETMVHADQVGSVGDIGPDKFTIPGLVTSLQSSIYAESSSAMVGGSRMVSAVTQAELDTDTEQLKNEVTEFAKAQLRLVGMGTWTGEAFATEVISEISDTKAGEEKDAVTFSIKIKTTGVFFDTKSLNDLVSAKLYENLEDGFVFKDSSETNFKLNVEITDASPVTGRAEMRVTVQNDSIVSNTNSFLQPETLVGKTPEEVKSYLTSAGLASDVSVWFFPPWLRKVPSMADHVTVQVAE